MKKLISVIIMLALLITIGASTSIVQAASCSVSVKASNSSPKVGDTVTVTVSFSPAVGAATVNLSYNNSVLQYVSSSNTWRAVNNGSSVTLEYADMSFTLPYKTISSMSATFKVKATGTSNCGVSGVVLGDAKNVPLTPSIRNSATITVKAPTSGGNSGSTTQKPSTGDNTNTNKPTNTNTNSSSTNNNQSKDPTFTSVNQTVYATSQVNVRGTWSTSGKLLGTLQKDDSLTRTGIGSNGWDRVIYKGQTAYINHDYLTTTKPKEEKPNENTTNNETTNNTTNEATNNTVNNETTNNEVTNTANNEVNNEEHNENSNSAVQNNQNAIQGENSSRANYVLYGIIGIIIIAIIIIVIVSVNESRRNRKNRRK